MSFISYTIPGATPLNQLNEPTADGLPDENANDNCVPASIAEALHILTGATFDGDALHDAVYGQGFIGFQAASAYVPYCAQHGVQLTAHNDTQVGLVATIHSEVAAGHPVLVTMPSQWGTAPIDPVSPSGSTHVGVAVGVGSGYIRVMNPWGGFWQDQPDSWWAARLCYGQVWVMQKAGNIMSGIPSGWTDDGTTLTAPNGVHVGHGFRAYILNNGWDANDYPLASEFSAAAPLNVVEFGNQKLGTGNAQYFRLSQLSWASPAPSFADANGVWRTWVGQEAMTLRGALASTLTALQTSQASLSAAQAQVTQLQAQLAACQAQSVPPPPTDPAVAAKAAALDALMACYGVK